MPADTDIFETLRQELRRGTLILAVGAAIEREGHFVRYFRGLPPDDQQALGRIMGELHTLMDRHFLPAPRTDP